MAARHLRAVAARPPISLTVSIGETAYTFHGFSRAECIAGLRQQVGVLVAGDDGIELTAILAHQQSAMELRPVDGLWAAYECDSDDGRTRLARGSFAEAFDGFCEAAETVSAALWSFA